MIKITKRQKEIIEASSRILKKSGVSGLTTKNLSIEMGFSESAIYRNFNSKEVIIITLLEFLMDEMDNRLSLISKSNYSVKEKFTRLFESQFVYFQENQQYVVAVFSDGLMEFSEAVNKTIQRLMEIKIKHIQSILEEGRTQQEITDQVPLESLIHMTLATFRLEMYKWRMAHFSYSIHESGNKTMKSLLKLITI